MKKLITTDLGGQPVYFKDFEFLQEQIRELVKTLLGDKLSNKVVIMNGVSPFIASDGYTITVTEGWAYYNKEFYYIPGQTVTGSSPNTAQWTIVESYDPRGLKTFKDVAVGDKNVYLVRELKLGFYPTTIGVLFSDTVRPNKTSSWRNKIVSGSSSLNIYYRKTALYHLEIVGFFENNGGSMHNTTIWTFPEDYWPFMKQVKTVVGLNNGCIGSLEFNTNGTLIYRGSGGDTNSYFPNAIYLNHTFFLSLSNI